MLFIEEVRYKKFPEWEATKWEPRQSLRYSRADTRKGIVGVRLRDIETGCAQEITSYSSISEFENVIRQSRPYGYLEPQWRGDEHDFLLVTTDKLSYQFQQEVESVVPIEFPQDDVRWTSLLNCKFYDSHGQFVEWWNTEEKYICTLFQMMCFLHKGWYDGKFYFCGARLRESRYNSGMCVTFKDVHKARAMIAKAIVDGHNPLRSYAESHGIAG